MGIEKVVTHWRIILAAVLDFISSLIVFGLIIAAFAGNLTENGLTLSGLPALIPFSLVFLYFWAFKRYFGGTIWKRILKVS